MPEVRRLILAMAGPKEEREFRLGWSLWRRAHQAVAKRCHTASRATRRTSAKDEPPFPPVSTTTTILDRKGARLTDEKWARLRPLLPDNGHRGKQWREHRTVVEAISCGFWSTAPLGGIYPKSLAPGRRPTNAT